MNNNDILRRLRYILNYSDEQMVEIFADVDQVVTINQVKNWLKKDKEGNLFELRDKHLACFLAGLIQKNRGKIKDPIIENKLTNNLILRKIKIAFELNTEELLKIYNLAQVKISKSELGAFFRNTEHKNYKVCNDQFLRGLLKGLQIKYRETSY